MTSQELVILAAGLGLYIVLLVCVLILFSRLKSLSHQYSDLEKRFFKSLKTQSLLQEELNEVRSGAIGLSNKVKELVVNVIGLSDKLNEIEYLDPETRLYAQATKMVESGATLEELMEECDLPRAEAELLMSVKQNRS
ncbi:MAG: DUF2802 domain-containing protein [Aliiglaciecola sp.]|uniref:DUF2802 domain-containing protein n=1 Tax=Aliiglaciecola sp. M165 TaxID=2593649 RepID=UPI0011816EC2|nr:DUF2802 domain-containing protein [Aliiglaciecola sp. M165]TRY29478.1 DUF2802 domain-containing protein [Aliiglaciecola sp. M165]